MTHYLLFTFAAPLASFGAVAVGERRPSFNRPTKSQIIGLVAASLGIERGQEAQQHALAQSLGFAVRIDQPGQLASDYHTTQSPKEVDLKRRAKIYGPARTRADELSLSKEDVKTILSRREYLAGSMHTIALWLLNDAAASLEKIEAALKTPDFTVFAGRKAFPLMLPMNPVCLEADNVETAFAIRNASEAEKIRSLKENLGIVSQSHCPIFADVSAIPDAERDARIARLEERRDHPENRKKWRFGLRAEALLRQPKPAEKTS